MTTMNEKLSVPLSNPAPDCERFIKAVTTDFEPDRPPLIEYVFDRAVTKFAFTYADQNDRDYATFSEAIKSGKIEAKKG